MTPIWTNLGLRYLDKLLYDKSIICSSAVS